MRTNPFSADYMNPLDVTAEFKKKNIDFKITFYRIVFSSLAEFYKIFSHLTLFLGYIQDVYTSSSIKTFT